MKYTLTLITTDGLTLEECLDLSVEDTITWADFINLTAVKDLLLLHPHMTLVDVTPDDMPNWFTDSEFLSRQLNHFGLKVTREAFKQTVYEEL